MVSSAALPRIFVTVPGVEDLESVIVLLRAASAEITDQHREFVIEGPLTPEQATAVWRLSRHRDHNSEGNHRLPAHRQPFALAGGDRTIRQGCASTRRRRGSDPLGDLVDV